MIMNTCGISSHTTSRAQGFTLVEILVALAVGMIGVLVIMQVLVVQDGYKRSTIGAGEAQTNGALALFEIERNLRMAGWGLSDSRLSQCANVQYYWDPTAAQAAAGAPAQGCSTDVGTHLPQLSFRPLVINSTAGVPDSIDISFSTSETRLSPATVDQAMPAPSAALNVDNTYGFRTGDLMIATNGSSCTMMQVSRPQAGQPQKIIHNSGNDCDPSGGGGVPCQFNAAGNTCKTAFPTNSLVFNVGAPVVKSFAIDANNNLVVTESFSKPVGGSLPVMSAAAQVLINDIVDLQAQYGLDTDADNRVDTFQDAAPAAANYNAQLRSVRIGLLARNGDYRRPTNGVCTATTAAPTWAGGSFSVPGGLPSCYTYRVFETIVPLRNLMWREG
jgi:type IV pilus assembly protein PilW